MSTDRFLIWMSIAISASAGCSAIAGVMAYVKRRPPLEGVLLGLFLGPIGVMIESRHPYLHRPIIDENAWNSLRSMMTYQQSGRESGRRSQKPG